MKTTINLLITGLILFVFMSINSFSQSWYESWERHPQNPIMDGPVNWTDNFYYPVVTHEDNTYKMWFTGWTDAREIGYAESEDGYSWDIHQTPVILSGIGNDWDYQKIANVVLRIDDTLRMWYSGAVSNWSAFSLGYAWSLDGITWQVNEEPVLEEASFPSMHYDGTIYHLYYTSGLNEDIYYATSEDGITWIKANGNNPVIERGAPGTWKEEWVIPDGLVMHNDTLHMFLTGHDGAASGYFFRTGYAWSVDYINWNVNDDYVFDVVAGGWESKQVSAGTILFEDDKYKMWYMGYGTSNEFAVGYAEIEMDPTCLPGGYTITNQSFIDAFPVNYPYCKEIKGDLTITGADITNLDGLSKIELIDGKLNIVNNPNLEYLSGFENLNTINGNFEITTNENLVDFTGLENLISLGGNLMITDNTSLTSLSGLDNIAPGSIENLVIAVNQNLSECDVYSICEYLAAPVGTVTIQANGPGCESEEVIHSICWNSIVEDQYRPIITIYPNPINEIATISYNLKYPRLIHINIFNHLGNLVKGIVEEQQQQGKHEVQWNTKGLPAGIYYCVLKTENETQTMKLVILK